MEKEQYFLLLFSVHYDVMALKSADDDVLRYFFYSDQTLTPAFVDITSRILESKISDVIWSEYLSIEIKSQLAN